MVFVTPGLYMHGHDQECDPLVQSGAPNELGPGSFPLCLYGADAGSRPGKLPCFSFLTAKAKCFP